MSRFATHLLLVSMALPLSAQVRSPPEPPLILEPAEGAVVSGEDVHMVAGGFRDPDGDEHLCTDWVILDRVDGTTAWSAPCATGFSASHVHLGDGTFAPDLTRNRQLKPSHEYMLRVRYRDDSGRVAREWSEWSSHRFRTTAVQELAAMVVVDVLESPAPRWRESSESELVLPASSQSFLRLETAAGEELLEVRALDGKGNQWIDMGPAEGHHPLKVIIGSGSSEESTILPASRLLFTSENQNEVMIHLPAIELEPGSELMFWVSANGSSHHAEPSQEHPDFSRIARANPVPWVVRESGYEIDLVAEGFQLPVAIEPVAEPGDAPDAPLLYVAELYGRVKVVSRDGSVTTYAEDLLNFDPFGDFPGAGERGLADLAIEPETGDLFVTLPYNPPDTWSGAFQPQVVRLISSEDGRRMVASETVLDLHGEWIGPSHQIANISIGPDGKLYVHVADGNCVECARHPGSARGKILRLELTGEAAVDNPFYDAADGITATDYIYALGFRNPFGGAWRSVDGYLYEVENGPTTDRFVRVEPGADYGWEGDDENMFVGALYNWTAAPAAAPVNIDFIQPETFGGSGFPVWKQDTAYVTESGPTWATGQPAVGKRIGEFVITAAGDLGGARRTFVQYNGTGKSTVAALAAGPGGLYFSDLYQDDELDSPIAAGAKIFRVRHVGSVSFQAEIGSGGGGCGSVRFREQSAIPDIENWTWRFGDGSTSGDQHPTHQFEECGVYAVDLRVEGPGGIREKNVVIAVGPYDGIGLAADYFSDELLEQRELSRIEQTIEFDWNGSPIPGDEGGFSARWSGSIRPRFSQIYQFSLNGSDGARLWIDRRLVIDDWNGKGAARTGRIELAADRQIPITIESRSGGEGSLELLWASESQTEELVPTESLYPKLPDRRRSVRR